MLKEGSTKVGIACPAFFCSCDGDLKGLCHGDDFCVVTRQKQSQTSGKVLEKRFEVKQTVHIGFGANDKKELKILNRTIKMDVLNDEMTLEADTKLVGGALKVMKLMRVDVYTTNVRCNVAGAWDSNWAGDLLGRKSTTGVIARRGEHLLRHMSCLQTLVAVSSGEAEYYALIRGACTSLGIQSHYQDWMIDVPIQIYSDSSAARSVARRRGIGGRLRHLQTRHLW